MKTYLISLIFLLTGMRLSGQSTKTISGSVRDSRNQTISGATVRLLQAADSALISGKITDAAGNFRFSNLDNATYVLVVSAMAQKDFKSTPLTIDDAHQMITLPAIVLLPARAVELDEVVVKTQKPLVEQEIDRTIVHVGAMIGTATSSTYDVLSKTPGVSLNSNGEVSLNGKGGVILLIEGRSTYMSGPDLAAYLKSLPGGVLDRIELVDNPPARYDAAGNAVIDIRLKKTRTGGLTGSIAAGASQGLYRRSNDALNLNYNRRKINLFANLSYNYEKNYISDDFTRRFYSDESALRSQVTLDNRLVTSAKGYNVNLGVDFASNSKTTYGAILNFNGSTRDGDFKYRSIQLDAMNKQTDSGDGTNISRDVRRNTSLNFNTLHKFNEKGRELSVDVNYLYYRNHGVQELENRSSESDNGITEIKNFTYHIPADMNIYTLKADYTHPLEHDARWEAGVKSSYIDNDFVFSRFNITDNTAIEDNKQSNHFQYRENINAVYTSVQKKWKHWGVQMGLRLENTIAQGHQVGNDSVAALRFTKNYTKLFPSFFLNYKPNDNHSVVFMGVRRITRPNYQMMNPFVFYKDRYSYSAGNPELSPQYQNRIEVKYQHKSFLSLALAYNWFTDIFLTTTHAQDEIFIVSPRNIATGSMIILNTTYSGSLTNWWHTNTTLRLSRIVGKGPVYANELNYSGNIARLEVNNYFNLSNSWRAELGGYYASRDLTGQAFTSGMFRMSGGIQKKIWKEKCVIALSFKDLFHSWVYHNRSIGIPQSEYYQVTSSDTRRVDLSFSYKFGKETLARKRRHSNNASDDEKLRVE